MEKNTYAKIIEDAKKLRWKIHHNPELSNKEKKTTDTLNSFFNSYGLKFNRFKNFYGGYVLIDVAAKQTVCFRADIDALPIKEQTGVKYSSGKPDCMHACGHDMHTAVAAGLAVVLQGKKDKLKKNVVILFQPAEENNPIGGAKAIIAEGFFKKMKITSIYGLHVWPSYKVGEIGTRCSALMGSSDRLRIEIKGKSAHAAEPNNGVDAIFIASEIINGVVHKIRREIDPFDASLATIGVVKSFGRYNIICDDVILEGTIRAASAQARAIYHKRIKEICRDIAKTYKGKASVEIADGYHVVYNDNNQTTEFIEFAEKHIGKKKVHSNINTSLIGEDFSFYTEVLPATFFFLGCESNYPLHSDKFCPKESTLDFAVSFLRDFFLR